MLSERTGVESEDEEKAGVGVDDGVEDGMDIGVGVNVGSGENFLFAGLRAEICTSAGVCASWGVCVGVFILGFQVGVFKLGCSSLCVQVGVFRWVRFMNPWFPSFDGVSLPNTSR
jgi:hypothetical protein